MFLAGFWPAALANVRSLFCLEGLWLLLCGSGGECMRVFNKQLICVFMLLLLLLLLQAALPHMKEGSSIINTSSITAFKGSPKLVDYSATKGAQVRETARQRDSCSDVGRTLGLCLLSDADAAWVLARDPRVGGALLLNPLVTAHGQSDDSDMCM
jgi:hypothetical protein